jgi:hypothetical protein
MLLKALALSNVSLLAVLCEPQILQRVELSLRTCILLQVQDATWTSAWHAVHDLQRILSSESPKPSWLYSNTSPNRQEKVLFIGSAESDNSSIIKVGECHPHST